MLDVDISTEGPKQESNCAQCGPVNPAVDAVNSQRVDLHIVNYMRTQVDLLPNQMTTGQHGRSFVLKPNVLRQGLSYMVQLTVTDKGTN